MTNYTIPPLAVDGYKIDHRRQLPPGVTKIYSNMTPRKSRVEGVDSVVVFGIQYYIISTLIEYWNKAFFQADIDKIAERFHKRMVSYTGLKEFADEIGTQHWRDLHKLGYLPIKIKALPEGTKCSIKVPFFTVTSTHKDFAWFAQYIETDMSAETWGMVTSATTADQYRRIFAKWAKHTGGDPGFVQFQAHDFSYRGMYGRQAAAMSGAAHLTSFVGTDTLPAIDFLDEYYEADSYNGLVGCSVFATEHAVMCISTGFYIKKNGLDWEKYGEAEFDVFKRLITEVYPKGIISVVSDTWDLWKVICSYLPKLKAEIMAREGKLVIRPDSGDPVQIISGLTPYDVYKKEGMVAKKNEEVQPWVKDGVVQLLWDIFGGTYNLAGYKVLDPHIGCIYGDSITPQRADAICSRLNDKKFCSTNWVAGIGSYTYQYVTRDTFGMAMKATYAEIDIDGITHGIEIFKDPITDDGTKKSARGLIQVYKRLDNGKTDGRDRQTWANEASGLLEVVFEDGKLIKKQTLKEIKQRIYESVA